MWVINSYGGQSSLQLTVKNTEGSPISKLAGDGIKRVGFRVNNYKVLQMAHLNTRLFSKLAVIKWKKHLGDTVGSS